MLLLILFKGVSPFPLYLVRQTLPFVQTLSSPGQTGRVDSRKHLHSHFCK